MAKLLLLAKRIGQNIVNEIALVISWSDDRVSKAIRHCAEPVWLLHRHGHFFSWNYVIRPGANRRPERHRSRNYNSSLVILNLFQPHDVLGNRGEIHRYHSFEWSRIGYQSNLQLGARRGYFGFGRLFIFPNSLKFVMNCFSLHANHLKQWHLNQFKVMLNRTKLFFLHQHWKKSQFLDSVRDLSIFQMICMTGRTIYRELQLT
jgi:hypothetical protein